MAVIGVIGGLLGEFFYKCLLYNYLVSTLPPYKQTHF